MTMIHHALMCRADSVQTFCLNETEITTEVCDQYFIKFGIDNARDLVLKSYNRPQTESTQCLIVRTDFITIEAQNALLKIVEEPPASTRFIFVIPHDLIILPTLASRFSNYVSDTEVVTSYQEFDLFLSQTYKDRLQAIEQATKGKDTDWQRAIKQGLIAYLEKATPVTQLESLEYIVRLLLTRGASNKMLLDHLALLLVERTAS